MTCPTVLSGDQFLGSTIHYLECAGQQLGQAGYQALAAPGSPLNLVLLTGLTLFIALLGLRLMVGERLDLGDASIGAVKIGLVLLLAASWPAVRVLLYDTAVKGPAELVAQVGGHPESIPDQLQNVDQGLVALTKWGTGKLDIRAGLTASGSPAASEFAGEATNESFGLAGGRLMFLLSSIAMVGVPRLLGGVLLSILPIVAGLLLFDRARSITFGWLRAWLFVVLTGFVGSLLLAIEIVMLQPWLVRVIAERSSNLATPSAPIELLAMTGSFAVVLLASVVLLARICFSFDASVILRRGAEALRQNGPTNAFSQPAPLLAATEVSEPSRAQHLSEAITQQVRRQNLNSNTMRFGRGSMAHDVGPDSEHPSYSRGSARRSIMRSSRSIRKRDLK